MAPWSESGRKATRHFSLLSSYIAQKRGEISRHNQGEGTGGGINANARRLTNIGTLRAYIRAYLQNHPQIHSGMTLLVRQLETRGEGVPIEIYCFTNVTEWAVYEEIQADIFDHIFATLPEFSLRLFQNVSDLGRDSAGMGGGARSIAN